VNANGQLIETLIRSQTFQNYEHAFSETTGMPMTLRTVESWRLPFHGKRQENAFCALMAGKSGTCGSCLGLQAKLSHGAMNHSATRTCAFGLCETAVPVKLGLETIGLLQTGQVMRQKPTEAAFKRAIVRAGLLGADISGEQTKRAYFKTPVVSQRKLDSLSDLLVIFADHLAMKSNEIVMIAANEESPVVTKAKQFIREHYTENLSLRIVANSVNTSPFYFCKLFRKSTTVTFTHFVLRTRVAKAKDFLLNPHLRISEIAFAVGFQSLTHFNRAFKKIVGYSPTAYRGKLLTVA
jgi:AraC-like DNA-binding protein